MAVTSIKNSSLTGIVKFDSVNAGNDTSKTNAFVLLDRQSVGATSVASITFSNIPQTYKHLQFRMVLRDSYSGVSYNVLDVRFNGDSGANYSTHTLQGAGSSVAATSGAVTSATFGQAGVYPTGAAAGTYGASIVDILDYSDKTKNTTIRTLSGWDSNSTGMMRLSGSAWYSTAPVTSITFAADVWTQYNLTQYTTISLYGVK